ncbi:uncharacterized protein [Coffea arabica]|uniref:PUM-HD domain-containing protein n=1 Tax=Coffea arabica TaxID=13443 RepID=A0A6P6ULA4_COFAR
MMFRVEEENVDGKMKGVMMNETSYANHGFLENNQPTMLMSSGPFVAMNSGLFSGVFDAIDNGSSSQSTVMTPFSFDGGMHQEKLNSAARNMGSGVFEKPSGESMLNVPYNAGLCENFSRMHVGDEQRDYCSTSKFRVDPDGFLGGFNDRLSNSVVGFSNHHVYDYSMGLGQVCDVKDFMGPSPFLTNRHSNALSREDQVDYYMRLVKEQGRGFCNQGVQGNRTSMVNGRPCFADDFYDTQQCGILDYNGLDSSQLSNPMLEMDLAYKLLMLNGNARGMPNTCVNLGRPMFSVTNAGEVGAPGCEDSFIVDGAGKCSKFVAEKKSNRSKGDKKSSRNEAVMSKSGEKDLVLDFVMQCQGVCANSAGHAQSQRKELCEDGLRPRNCSSLPAQLYYRSPAELQGYIYPMCKHQLGCRFLQRVFDEGNSQDIQIIFTEIIDHVVELMVDPFANYLIQKLLDVCSEDQKLVIVLKLTNKRGELVDICMNTHGTRVVQKLIEAIKSRQQISLIMVALKPGLLDLIKDQNGNHVVQRCLQSLTIDQNKFIFDAAAKFCVDIACHRHGCCVLNRCVAYSSGKHREKLVSSISANGLLLSQDAFGNYVIQYIIELKIPSAAATLLSQFEGHFVFLSMQKFSSHVVEKCLRCLKDSQPRIITELLSVRHFDQLLQDRFANYVVQSALEATKGPLRTLLVEAICPYSEILRTSPYCKKIFSRNLLKK